MEFNWVAIFSALGAGLATGLGAIPIYFKKEFSKSSLDVGLGFSAGIMLVASFISLILPGIEVGKRIFGEKFALIAVLSGLFIGYIFIILIHEFIPHKHLMKRDDMRHGKKFSRIVLIILAISIHNIPEGLTVGVGFGGSNMTDGIALALAIAIQNIPEGLVVAFGLLSEGASKHKAFLMALLSGLIEPIAAFFGHMSTQITHYSLPVALGFAGGAMLFVTCQEIFPELFKEGHEKKSTLGVISGVVTMLIIDYYLK